MPFKSFSELDKNSNFNNSNEDYSYGANFTSPNGLFLSDDYDNNDIASLLSEQLDNRFFNSGNKKIDSNKLADNIISLIPNDHKGKPITGDFDKECIDINNLKNYAIYVLTGKGNPAKAHPSLLNKDDLNNNIYKLDHNKINNLINKLNNSLDKKTLPIRDPKSLYNQVRNFEEHDVVSGTDLENAFGNIFIKNDLEPSNDVNEITNGLTNGTIKDISPDSLESLLNNYNLLKEKMNYYTSSIKSGRKEEYLIDQKALNNTRKFLKNTFGYTDKELDEKIDVDTKISEYKGFVKGGHGLLKQNIDALTKKAAEYNSHGRLWKIFLGRTARNEMDNLTKNLKNMGVSNNLINAIKNGNTNNKEFFENEYNNLKNSLSDIRGLTISEINAVESKFVALRSICQNEEIKYDLENGNRVFRNAIKNADNNGNRYQLKEPLDFDKVMDFELNNLDDLSIQEEFEKQMDEEFKETGKYGGKEEVDYKNENFVVDRKEYDMF